MSKFSVCGGITESMRLKDISADVNSVTAKVTIVLETDNMFAFGECAASFASGSTRTGSNIQRMAFPSWRALS